MMKRDRRFRCQRAIMVVCALTQPSCGFHTMLVAPLGCTWESRSNGNYRRQRPPHKWERRGSCFSDNVYLLDRSHLLILSSANDGVKDDGSERLKGNSGDVSREEVVGDTTGQGQEREQGLEQEGVVRTSEVGAEGEEWTVEKCRKRLSTLHRKLRQVKGLCFEHSRNPDSLDAAQLAKVGRKESLEAEIAELEALRRSIERAREEKESEMEHDEASPSSTSSTVDGGREREIGGVRYTVDGYRLADPRKRIKAGQVDPGWSSPTPAGPEENDRVAPDGEFQWDEGFEDMERAVETGDSGMEEESLGGYPKRLSSLMSFCRVSTKATCEILVSLGRVTVNGETVKNPFAKVDVLKDRVVCDGVAMTLPPKIDNSDINRRPREDIGKRTGPIPKAEKNTWKSKVRYRWRTDGGLLASRTRGAAKVKAKKKARSVWSDWGADYR